MHELLHILEHALGLCGDKHPSIIAIISEWHNFSPIFKYKKTIFKKCPTLGEYSGLPSVKSYENE
jgi:hypothetical protein